VNVARLLQRSDVTPGESLSAVASLKRTLQNIRENLPHLVTEASRLQLEPPAEKRQTKTPAKLRHDGKPEARSDENFDFHTSLVASFRSGVDIMLQELEDRFNSPGITLAIRRENVYTESSC